jgi:VIT1/CCC1 family predicted Fe2+/Mn2+ transporter
MRSRDRHVERHRNSRTGWLRAAVLGANDGIVSTASLIAGVAAARAIHGNVLLAGVSALVAGAMSMAAGEYVSVHSQADTEKADIERERAEIDADPDGERRELSAIYVRRGLEPDLARAVAVQLMRRDPLAAHARDELGIVTATRARPVQAALASATGFAAGAVLPLGVAAIAPPSAVLPWLFGASLAALALLGVLAARAGGADAVRGAVRVYFLGCARDGRHGCRGRAVRGTVELIAVPPLCS